MDESELQNLSKKILKLNKNSDEFGEALRKIWTTKKMPGSYTGVRHFRRFLNYELGVKIGERNLRKILQQIPSFNIYLRHQTKYRTRKYNVHGSNNLWEADLISMYEFEGLKWILIVVDCFNHKTWTRIVKNKTAGEIQTAFKSIFKEANAKPSVLECDRGMVK